MLILVNLGVNNSMSYVFVFFDIFFEPRLFSWDYPPLSPGLWRVKTDFIDFAELYKAPIAILRYLRAGSIAIRR